jgi:hypothetical protein
MLSSPDDGGKEKTWATTEDTEEHSGNLVHGGILLARKRPIFLHGA